MKCDLRKLDLLDNYADRAVAIHVFEHFYYWETQALLLEWKRVLRAGGMLVLELPCMDRILNHIFLRMKKGEEPHPAFSWFPLWGDPSYKDPAMCHKWGYFKKDMETVLTKAGFVDVKIEEARYHFPQRDMRAVARKPS